MTKKYDVVALSALCVDAQVVGDDALLERHGLQKAASNDVGAPALARITAEPNLPKTAGSPGANVASGIALRGGASALIGKIANDDLGIFFSGRVQSFGVDYTPLLTEDKDKGTTFILVVTTPDKERTFACYNGAGLSLSPEDVDETLIRQAKITYLDSYLWLSESGKETVHHAAATAKANGSKIALSLNDAGIIARNRAEYLALAQQADILLGDRKEFSALLSTTTPEETAAALGKMNVLATMTAGAKGAYVIENGVMTHVPALKVERIVDTSGAGDQFAAGFLYGIAQGKTGVEAAQQGAAWAADIIQHFGAEPKVGRNALPPTPSGPSGKSAPSV